MKFKLKLFGILPDGIFGSDLLAADDDDPAPKPALHSRHPSNETAT